MRSLSEIIEALEIAEEEFRFHAARLRDTPAQTDDEEGHITNLSTLYADASRAARILGRYQRGRRRAGAPITPGAGIDERGVAEAVVG